MNVIKLNKFIAEIRQQYSEEQLRKMFTDEQRRFDEFFESVGYKALRKEVLVSVPAHIPVWKGYELLLGINKV